MTTSLLPTEILEDIAKHLEVPEWCVCQVVCRSWRSTFQARLFANVCIDTRKRFKRFLKLTSSVGCFVKDLDILFRVPVLQHELDQLAANLPNLRRVCINERYLQRLKFMQAFSSWTNLHKLNEGLGRPRVAVSVITGLGPRLTELGLSAPATQMLVDSDSLMQSLPNLEHLFLFEYGPFQKAKVRIRPSRLAALHRYMPRMHHLNLLGVILEQETGMETTLDFTFEKLQVLKLIRCLVSDPRWLEYLPRLFASVTTAQLYIRYDYEEHDTNTARFRHIQRLSLDLLTAFAKLQWLQYHINSVTSEELSVALKEIQASGKRYECIEIHGHFAMDIQKAILELHKSDIRSLDAVAWEELINLDNFIQPIVTFQLLEELSINMEPAEDHALDIHDILSNLLRLKSFTAVHCILFNNYSKKGGQHSLAELDFIDCLVSLSTLDYLSRVCTEIKRLSLSDVAIESNETNRIEISLPECALDTCFLDTVTIIWELEWASLKCPGFATLLNLTQSSKDYFRRLYHEYWVPTKENGFSQLQHLEFVEAMDLDMECDRDNWLDYEELDCPLAKGEWTQAVKYGYINLVCTSVKKVKLNGAPALRFYC